MIKCRYCAEEIQDEAIKCKHCGSMLDDSKNTPSKVVVNGIDPFAHYHTDIQKKDGKISIIGYMGIGVGLLIVIVVCYIVKPMLQSDKLSLEMLISSIVTIMFGIFFMCASYLWARRK